tara:strand:+ start:375 stop:539 length:165 start_codon:yes stop_codon:yes gene_type:complete
MINKHYHQKPIKGVHFECENKGCRGFFNSTYKNSNGKCRACNNLEKKNKRNKNA